MLDRIDLLVLDVDGVLTDGRIVYSAAGDEIKAFDVRDGHGVKLWQRAGHDAAILSGRASPAIHRRAADLGIEHVVEGAKDKWPAMRALLDELGRTPDRAAYVGDDLPDVPVMARVGFAAAVPDAAGEARRVAHYVTRAPGGAGAVREVIELILGHQGRWAGVMRRYRDAVPDGLPPSRDPWRGEPR